MLLSPVLRFTLSRPASLAALAPRWREMERHCRASFFQSWTWTGCLAEERFPDPVLLEGFAGDRPAALALFNRRRGRLGMQTLFLGETGDAAWDASFIEHNGILLTDEAAAAPALRAARCAALDGWRPFPPRALVASGLDAGLASAMGAAPKQTRVAPRLDLASLRRDGRNHMDALSANTRQQLRRSLRRYAEAGALRVVRAETVAQAQDFLASLAGLHQETWTRRGRPGAFANPQFRRFHEALVARGLDAGEIDLLHIAAGAETIGYLYNFRHRGIVSAYQSGFRYPEGDSHRKPGLTCHHLAIERYAEDGIETYDFLAGADRYKTSLANAATTLGWFEIGTPRAWLRRLAAPTRHART